ncbi:hypothetical protein MTR67_044782 [Solanum verrucosum]|uniref:Tf2-1-like SH3-like domain-containing protein n=1 Tax=Solanum verrucosum TaxID=315347 RepID=A0AAF0URV3_SOLVR|nr:hypothetical protein MTR67_044782 [Solanum verrucosum]
MPIPEWKWEIITMNFVIGLPKTLGKFDSVWVVVEKLTKSAHFIPVRVDYLSVRGHWDKFLPLCEFSYNNNYQSSIDMAPFKALYGRGCRSPIWWFEAGDVKPLGVDLLKDAQNKVRNIQGKLIATQSRHKKYADRKVRDMQFQTGTVAYRLDLPPSLSGVHPVLHVSILKKYHIDGDYIIKWDSALLVKDLQFEEESVVILDRDVWKLRTKEIKSVKVQRKHRSVEKATWETDKYMRDKYPSCSTIQVLLYSCLSHFS